MLALKQWNCKYRAECLFEIKWGSAASYWKGKSETISVSFFTDNMKLFISRALMNHTKTHCSNVLVNIAKCQDVLLFEWKTFFRPIFRTQVFKFLLSVLEKTFCHSTSEYCSWISWFLKIFFFIQLKWSEVHTATSLRQ